MNINDAIRSAQEHYRAGDLQKAAGLYAEIARVQPDHPDSLFMLGTINAQTGNLNAAAEYFRKLIAVHPTHTGAYYNLGNVYRDQGQFSEAFKWYQKTIQLNPGHAEAFINIGIIFRMQGRLDEEAACYQKAIQLDPRSAAAFFNLGHYFFEKEQFDKALACYEKVSLLNPNSPYPYLNMGLVLTIKGLYDQAMSSYEKAIRVEPENSEAHWNLANVLLLTGNFERGWKEYVWLWKTNDYIKRRRNFTQPSWDRPETDIRGRTLLLYAEYGFGDTIQFIRYAPLIAERGAKVIVECQRDLASLLQNTEGIQEVIPYGEQLPEFDSHCSLMMLPALFNTAIGDIPNKVPYLDRQPVLIRKWREKLGDDTAKLKAGIAWSGVSTRKKFCPLETFAPLAQLTGISFYSLQKGEAVKEASHPPNGMRIYDYTEEMNDFSDTAALIENLDLVISIDTSVAHLAGALGKPVWTLLPFVPDWRWMLNRNDSPWYPTMKLFRQPAHGDWESVIARIAETLQTKREEEGGT
jgi:tetratricopeptide (TPR) repeat protein